jgi:Alginate export
MNYPVKTGLSFGLFFMLNISICLAQFNIGGQVLQRTEFRNGYGTLLADSLEPAAFIGQRFRLEADYSIKNLEIFGSVQDVRTWGNTSQANEPSNNTGFHQAWVKLTVDSLWNIKLGRQELNYDNTRFLGAADWGLPGRVHDFALVTFQKNRSKVHFGGGFNQTNQNLNSTIYTLANQYKTAQFFWYNHKGNDTEVSFLFWNDGRQYWETDSLGHPINGDVRMSQTIGFPTLRWTGTTGFEINGFAYYQTGKDVQNKKLRAYDVSLWVSKAFPYTSKKSQFKTTLGAELISGNDISNTSNTNRAYTPMYGTNHVHNGFMDYFYVGGRGENTVGLNDIFLRFRFDKDLRKKWFTCLDIHYFSANGQLDNDAGKQDQYLATEIDLTGGVVLNKSVSLQLAYCQLVTGSGMEQIRNTSTEQVQNWVYAMLIIRPFSNSKFIGVFN